MINRSENKLMNNLNTTYDHNYQYFTEYLEIYILGGINTTELETLCITLSDKNPEAIMCYDTDWTCTTVTSWKN
ncbi:MAG: hypothetical protein R3353_00035 [Salegentibacter mishustinae]|nr:hypothetical protein [Salegentibacter mishustinae]